MGSSRDGAGDGLLFDGPKGGQCLVCRAVQPVKQALKRRASPHTHQLLSVLDKGLHIVEAAHVDGHVIRYCDVAPGMPGPQHAYSAAGMPRQDVENFRLTGWSIAARLPGKVAPEVHDALCASLGQSRHQTAS